MPRFPLSPSRMLKRYGYAAAKKAFRGDRAGMSGVSGGSGNIYMDIQVDQKQLAAIDKMLRELPGNIGRNALRAAIRAAAARTQDRAMQILDSGTKLRTGRLSGNLRVTFIRKYGDHFHKAKIGVPLGKSRADTAGAYYAGFVEFGHDTEIQSRFNVETGAFSSSKWSRRPGPHVSAVPFLGQGLESTNAQNLAEFPGRIRAEVEKRVARLPKAQRPQLNF